MDFSLKVESRDSVFTNRKLMNVEQMHWKAKKKVAWICFKYINCSCSSSQSLKLNKLNVTLKNMGLFILFYFKLVSFVRSARRRLSAFLHPYNVEAPLYLW